jgi:hypothetical protein
MFLTRRLVNVLAVGATAAALSALGLAVAQAETGSSNTGVSSGSCSGTVRLSDVDLSVSGGQVVVTFDHTTTGCPTTLHVHENLLSSPNAGSNSSHQLNQDFTITANGPSRVSVPLLSAVTGFCWVQADAHWSGGAVGEFFRTATCITPFSGSNPPPTSETPTPVIHTVTTPPPTTTPSTPVIHTTPSSPTETTTATVPVPPTGPTTSQGVLPPVSVQTGQQAIQPVANRWPMSTIVVGTIAVLLILGGGLALLVRRSRHAVK